MSLRSVKNSNLRFGLLGLTFFLFFSPRLQSPSHRIVLYPNTILRAHAIKAVALPPGSGIEAAQNHPIVNRSNLQILELQNNTKGTLPNYSHATIPYKRLHRGKYHFVVEDSKYEWIGQG